MCVHSEFVKSTAIVDIAVALYPLYVVVAGYVVGIYFVTVVGVMV